MPVFVKYILAWFPMLLIAILNGTLREAYKPFTGNLTAHQLSTVTLIIFFSFYIYYVTNKIPLTSGLQALAIGMIWVILTLAFEFGFGRFRGNSWSTLLEDYNLLKGRIWVLIPLWVLIAPYIFYKLKR